MDKDTEELFNSAPIERQEVINTIMASLRLAKDYSFRLRGRVTATLVNFSDDTLRLIITSLAASNDHREISYIAKRAELASCLFTRPNATELTVREVMSLWNGYDPDLAPSDPHEAVHMIKGLKRISVFEGSSLDDLNGERIALASAFLNVTAILSKYCEKHLLHHDLDPADINEASYYINDPALIDLIVQHHDRVSEFVNFIRVNQNQEGGDIINGLPHVEHFKNRGFDSITEADIDNAIAYLNVTTVINMHAEESDKIISFADDFGAIYLDDIEVQELVISNPQRAEDIIAYVMERESANPTALRSYLDNGTALRTGVL